MCVFFRVFVESLWLFTATSTPSTRSLPLMSRSGARKRRHRDGEGVDGRGKTHGRQGRRRRRHGAAARRLGLRRGRDGQPRRRRRRRPPRLGRRGLGRPRRGPRVRVRDGVGDAEGDEPLVVGRFFRLRLFYGFWGFAAHGCFPGGGAPPAASSGAGAHFPALPRRPRSRGPRLFVFESRLRPRIFGSGFCRRSLQNPRNSLQESSLSCTTSRGLLLLTTMRI